MSCLSSVVEVFHSQINFLFQPLDPYEGETAAKIRKYFEEKRYNLKAWERMKLQDPPKEIEKLQQQCLQPDYNKRTTFQDIKEQLKNLVERLEKEEKEQLEKPKPQSDIKDTREKKIEEGEIKIGSQTTRVEYGDEDKKDKQEE